MAFGGYSRGEALGLIIGTLAAIGVGVGFGALLLKKPEPGAAAQATAKDAQPNSEVRTLAPIVTNLGSPAETFVRLQAAIVLELNTPNSDALAAKVGDEIVAYLRTVPITEIQGPTGFQFLREELKRRAVQFGGGKIRDFLITTFVIE
jgi:flagellar FliL protein